MKHVDILFLYEHVARELDVACAVKYYLQERYGLSVEIAQQPFAVPEAIRTLEPALVVLPFCYSASLKHYPFLLDWRDKIFVNAMWEQLYYPGNRAAKIPRGEFETQHVFHHAWSLNTLALLRDCDVPRENIFLNGNLAYTLYDPPYRALFEDRSTLARRYGLDPQKRWVFFPENYNWAFFEDWRLDDLSASGLDRQAMSEMAIFCRDSLAQVVRWCAEISTRSDVELIVRPRPSTPTLQFATAIDNLIPNRSSQFHILKEGTVREWIMASDIVISSYSTTLIEAAIAGKPSFMLEPIPIPSSLHAEWHGYLPHLTTNAEFQAACLSSTPADIPLGAWARRTMMAHGDSILNFANFLAKLRQGQIARPPIPSRAYILGTNSNSLSSWVAFENRRVRERTQRTRTPSQWAAIYEKDLLGPGQLGERVVHVGIVISNTSGNAPLTEPILET